MNSEDLVIYFYSETAVGRGFYISADHAVKKEVLSIVDKHNELLGEAFGLAIMPLSKEKKFEHEHFKAYDYDINDIVMIKNDSKVIWPLNDWEIKEWKKTWGKSHSEICVELDLEEGSAAEFLSQGNYFWDEKEQLWLKSYSGDFDSRDRFIARRLNRKSGE